MGMFGYYLAGGFGRHLFGYSPFSHGLAVFPMFGPLLLIAIGVAIWYFASGRHHATADGAMVASHGCAPTAVPAPPVTSSAYDSAEEIVRRRLASGEIDAEQYELLITTLRSRS